MDVAPECQGSEQIDEDKMGSNVLWSPGLGAGLYPGDTVSMEDTH